MHIFLSRDIKRLFVLLACALAVIFGAVEALLWAQHGTFPWPVALLFLLLSACVLGCAFLFFRRQQQTLQDGIAQIERFLSGDTGARIASESEGSLSKLFQAVNTLATTLDAQADKQQQAKVLLQNTLSDISHQLKTPLAALEIYIALLHEEHDDPAAVLAFAGKSERELARIESLVQSLLKITRLDAGFITMMRAPLSLANILRDICLSFETRAMAEGKTITCSGPDDAMILGDQDWLAEAVSNLVKNALDHTASGDSIQVTWERLPTVTQIRIEDNGCGIPPEDIFHIFKRFYRSRHAKDTQGLGLGLPLAKAIVEAHEGTISVDSEPGRQTTFTMTFPTLTKL